MNTEKYKNLLNQELEGLTKSLNDLGVNNPDVEEDWVERTNDLESVTADLNDVADRTEEYDARRAELSVLEKRWNEVRIALKKIEAGTYGICEISGEPIEEDRLDVNPAARTCKEHMDENIS